MIIHPMREPVRVEFHLNGGYTRVTYERVPGHWADIPMSVIPYHLRPLGSRFIIVFAGIWPEPCDTAEELRAAIEIRVEEFGRAG